jgi:hypothetical protein
MPRRRESQPSKNLSAEVRVYPATDEGSDLTKIPPKRPSKQSLGIREDIRGGFQGISLA